MSKFDELKKLAEAATPGPWVLCKYGSVMADATNCSIVPAETGMQDNGFIAAANPTAILELLAIQAQLVEALKGLDDSFCSINEFSTKEERHQARMNLIAARAAVAAAEAKL